MNIEKLSSAGVAAVTARGARQLREVADTCKKLASENNILREKVANYEKQEAAREIATAMEQKNLNGHQTFEEKVASIMQASDLDRIRAAVDMAGPGSVSLAEVESTSGSQHDERASIHEYFRTGY